MWRRNSEHRIRELSPHLLEAVKKTVRERLRGDHQAQAKSERMAK